MKFPAVFLGHGSPMNAIEHDNRFNQNFTALGQAITARFGTPKAILMVSAHWHGKSLRVMTGENNPIIYDFYGFPDELYQVQYPAKGSTALAQQVMTLLADFGVVGDDSRGLDHGAWAVLKHMYPTANIPVVQLSLHLGKPMDWHWQLAQCLATLRDEGVLIMGSGNIVHNLAAMRADIAYPWAQQFASQINQAIHTQDIQTLTNIDELGESAKLSVPVPYEHYLPLLYVLGVRDEMDRLCIFNDEIVLGSLSMTSVVVGMDIVN